jgi:hypothetical protein
MSRREAERLEVALQAAARGETVEGPLTPLIQMAGQLAVLTEPAPPPPYGLQPGRQRFLAEAARRRDESFYRPGARASVAGFVKLAGALIATLLLFGLVFGVGKALAGGLPGEPLYAFELAIEDVRTTLTTDPQAKANLSVALAEERLDEIVALLEEGQIPADSALDRTTQQLRMALEVAVEAGNSTAVGALLRLELAIQQREQTMAAVMGSLAEAERARLQKVLQVMEQVRLAARAGQEDPDGLRWRLRKGMPLDPALQPDPSHTPKPNPSPAPQGAHPTQRPGVSPVPDPSPTGRSGGPRPTPQPGAGASPGPRPTHTASGEGPGTAGGPGKAQQPTRDAGPKPTDEPRGSQPTDQPGAGPGSDAESTPMPVGAGPTERPAGSQPTGQAGEGPGSGPQPTAGTGQPYQTDEPEPDPETQPTGEPPGPGPGDEPGRGDGSPPTGEAGNGGHRNP